MPDLFKKFTKAARQISSEKSRPEYVYGAFVDNLSDIDIDNLPEEVQIIYESVKMRLTSTVPPGKISNDEANWIAEDILYMADVVRSHRKKT